MKNFYITVNTEKEEHQFKFKASEATFAMERAIEKFPNWTSMVIVVVNKDVK